MPKWKNPYGEYPNKMGEYTGRNPDHTTFTLFFDPNNQDRKWFKKKDNGYWKSLCEYPVSFEWLDEEE